MTVADLRCAVRSERGGGHAENEDVALAQRHPGDESLLLCVLADGQGGRSGGPQAAQTASAAALSWVSALSASRLRGSLRGKHTWVSVLVGADEAVTQTSSDGFTTLIGLSVSARSVVGASCGDSGVLLVHGAKGKAKWLTENQRKNPPVGSGAAHPVAFFARLYPGDTLLVMSDGVFRYVGVDALVETCHRASEPEAIASALLELQTRQSQSGGLSDDFSVIVVQT